MDMTTAPAGDLYTGFLDPFIAALSGADPQPLRLDGRQHLIADPPITTQAALDWLFEGRATPPLARFRPDPEQHPAAGPQTRFYFVPNKNDIDSLRPAFLERLHYDGPDWTFDELLPDWLPQDVRDEAHRLKDQGQLRAANLPVVETFAGVAPWGRIVLWIGRGDFLRGPLEMYFLQLLPGRPRLLRRRLWARFREVAAGPLRLQGVERRHAVL